MNINSGSDYVRNYNLFAVFISHKQLRNSGLECLHAREGKLKEVSAQSTRTAEAKAAEEHSHACTNVTKQLRCEHAGHTVGDALDRFIGGRRGVKEELINCGPHLLSVVV